MLGLVIGKHRRKKEASASPSSDKRTSLNKSFLMKPDLVGYIQESVRVTIVNVGVTHIGQ